MQSLDLALTKNTAVGRKVQVPWDQLSSLVNLNTRELMLVVGAPGSGKSTLAVAWASKIEQPVLYLTQDSPVSVYTRLAALTLNEPIHTIRKKMQEGGSMRDSIVREVRKRERRTLIVEGGRRTTTDIGRRILALTEWMGEPPALVVLDNLIDLDMEGTSHAETTFYAQALTRLKAMVNEMDVAFLVLHHSLKNESVGTGESPLKMTDLLFGGDREARHVLGVYHDEDATKLTVQVLKQQDGPASPSGKLWVNLAWVPETGALIGRK